MKIKYALVKLDCALVVQILEMDERFRCPEHKSIPPHVAPNGFKIGSSSKPALGSTTLLLRGYDRNGDFVPVCCAYPTNEERDLAYIKINSALQDWAKNAVSWKETDPAEPTKLDNIFTLY